MPAHAEAKKYPDGLKRPAFVGSALLGRIIA